MSKAASAGFLYLILAVLPGLAQEPTVDQLSARAEGGDARAQYELGLSYERGLDLIPQNYEQAARWYRLAAEQGHAEAQSALGHLYAEGKGVPLNDREAARWLELAAVQGVGQAQAVLAISYLEGIGVVKDPSLAAHWFRLAADQGHAGAQWGLGLIYGEGRGVPQDSRQAIRWLERAAQNGLEARSKQTLDEMYRLGRLSVVGLPAPEGDDANFVEVRRASHLDMEFAARARPCELSQLSSRELLEAGHIAIGTAAAQQVSLRCRSGAAKDCREQTHTHPTQLLLVDSAKAGGDIVRPIVDRVEARQEEWDGEVCAEWTMLTSSEYYCPPVGGAPCYSRPIYKHVCRRYTGIVSSATHYLGSAGTIWRREPELAASQLRAFKLLRAAEDNDVETARGLLEAGLSPAIATFDPDAGEVRLPLHAAAAGGHEETVALLLSKGASAPAIDQRGDTAFRLALQGGHVDLARTLIEAGGVVDANMDDAVWAVRAGAAPLVSALISRGVNINGQDEDGFRLLSHALIAGQPDSVRVLLAAGADPNLSYDRVENYAGNTALHLALNPFAGLTDSELVEIVGLLLEYGARDSTSKLGDTPLHFAAVRSEPRLVKLFIDHGFGIDTKDRNGETPLLKAASKGRDQHVALLLEAGADANARSKDGTNALMWFNLLDLETIRALLEAGADPNAKNKWRNTPAKAAKQATKAGGEKSAHASQVMVLFSKYGR